MPNMGAGALFVDVQAGQTITKTAEELITLLGLNDSNKFFNVQNVAGMNGHYKISFDNLS